MFVASRNDRIVVRRVHGRLADASAGCGARPTGSLADWAICRPRTVTMWATFSPHLPVSTSVINIEFIPLRFDGCSSVPRRFGARFHLPGIGSGSGVRRCRRCGAVRCGAVAGRLQVRRAKTSFRVGPQIFGKQEGLQSIGREGAVNARCFIPGAAVSGWLEKVVALIAPLALAQANLPLAITSERKPWDHPS